MASLMLLVLTSGAHAQLLGHDLDVQWRFPDFNTVLEEYLVTVDTGVEIPDDDIVNSNGFEVDIDDDSIIFRFSSTSSWTGEAFNGFYFSDINDRIPPITGFDIESTTSGVGGLEPSALEFSEDAVWANFAGVVASIQLGPQEIRLRVNFDTLQVQIDGDCPGPVTVMATNATPNASLAILYANNVGNAVIPGGFQCAGTTLKLDNSVRLITLMSADANGNAGTTGTAPANTCGGFVQVLELGTCQVSDVERL